MNRSPRPHVFRIRPVGPVVVALILLVGACGGGDDEGASTTSTSPTSSTGSIEPGATTVAGGLQNQTFTVGEHFWHSGFRVDVVEGEILSTEDQLTRKVTSQLTLTLVLENLGDATGFFGPEAAVITSTNAYPSGFSRDIPEVPGGLKSEGRLVFAIDETFDLSGAELVVGDAGDSQARIPLAGTAEPVRLEPSEQPLSGTLSMELVDFNFTSVELRYDIPERHRQVEAGKLALTLHFDALSRKSGNWQIFADDLALILPTGVAIAPAAVEIGSLPGSDAGLVTQDRYAQFLIDDMPAGTYTLRLAPGSWFIGDDGVTESTFDFTLG